MKEKTDECIPGTLPIPLPPEAARNTSGASGKAPFTKCKKPHMLPPLEKFRSLQEGGRGSPVPQRRSSLEDQLILDETAAAAADAPEPRPVIRLTRCTDGPSPAPPLSRYAPHQPVRRAAAPTEPAAPEPTSADGEEAD